jgi:hypothetical protein
MQAVLAGLVETMFQGTEGRVKIPVTITTADYSYTHVCITYLR